MMTIITGKINSGKSTTIKQRYDISNKGDGFVSLKTMQKDKVHSYDILRLKTNETKLFVIREEFFQHDVEVECQIGPYIFIKEAFDYIEKEIRQMIKSNVSPIYLDEIGELELYDKCFSTVFQEIVDSQLDCVITVREDLIQKVVNKFNIKEVEIITV